MSVPVFCCLFILDFPRIKSPLKIRENPIKISVSEPSRAPKEGQRGPTWCPGGQVARRREGPRRVAAWTPGAPLATLLHLFNLRDAKSPRTEPFFAISPLFRRRRASKIGSASRLLPGTLPEGGLTSGSFPSTMEASRMCRE